jgi:hypothetical protein
MAGWQVEAAKQRTVAEQAAIDEKKKQLYVHINMKHAAYRGDVAGALYR